MAPRLAEATYSSEEGFTLRFRPGNLRLLPDATRDHLKAANKELLLALRSVIDRVIEGTEPDEPRPHRHVHVRVENETGEEEASSETEGTSGTSGA